MTWRMSEFGARKIGLSCRVLLHSLWVGLVKPVVDRCNLLEGTKETPKLELECQSHFHLSFLSAGCN